MLRIFRRSGSAAKRLGGLRAKRHGDAFENIFEHHAKIQGITCTRMPNGCKTIGAHRIIRVKTPWDWILTHKGTSAFLDTKSIAGSTFPFSAIERHQVIPMHAHATSGAIGGYIVWLREVNSVIFIPVVLLMRAIGARGAFKMTDAGIILLGQCSNICLAVLFDAK